MPTRRLSPVRALVLASLTLAVTLSGCGYSIRPPYDPTIQTVYVPIFRSVTFRRDVNLQLTEEVIKEIERRTPYKIVPTEAEADATLDGEVNFADKNLIVESPFNLPRQLTANMTVNVRYIDNRLPDEEKEKLKLQPPAMVAEIFYFNPELGETAQLAFMKVNQKLARQIVGMMENRW